MEADGMDKYFMDWTYDQGFFQLFMQYSRTLETWLPVVKEPEMLTMFKVSQA